jgi:hypothetical protein
LVSKFVGLFLGYFIVGAARKSAYSIEVVFNRINYTIDEEDWEKVQKYVGDETWEGAFSTGVVEAYP